MPGKSYNHAEQIATIKLVRAEVKAPELHRGWDHYRFCLKINTGGAKSASGGVKKCLGGWKVRRGKDCARGGVVDAKSASWATRKIVQTGTWCFMWLGWGWAWVGVGMLGLGWGCAGRPTGSQDIPKGPPRDPQETPKRPIVAIQQTPGRPKGSQETPERPQETPKGLSYGPTMAIQQTPGHPKGSQDSKYSLGAQWLGKGCAERRWGCAEYGLAPI